jgi:hypothetical protein
MAEAEAAIGTRGHVSISSSNRGLVKKWLTAQGFPSLFCAGLSVTELAIAYNNTDGSGVAKLRAKLEKNTAGDFEETDAAEKVIDGETATQRSERFIAELDGKAATSGNTDAAEIAAVVAAVIGAMPPRGVDENKVRQIAEAAVAAKSMTPDAIKALVADEAPKHVKVTRIEVKLPGQDSFKEIEGIQHPAFARLLRAASSRQADGHHPNIWISGPAGSGKTYAAKTIAKAMGLEFFFNGALSMSHELLGFIDAGGTYHATPFWHGYSRPAVYLFDEVDGSDNSALLALNAALANGRASFPNGQVERHKDSVIIATANTWGLGATADYVGRAKIDAAFLSRFPVRIGWDYDEDMERQICGNEAWAKRVQRARAKARAAGIKVLIDPRTSIAGAALIAGGYSEQQAAEDTYLANLTPEQRRTVDA